MKIPLILCILIIYMYNEEVWVSAAWSYANATKIRTDKVKAATNDPMVRPSETVEIKAAFNLISINDVSMSDQSVAVTGWFTVEWEDHRLEWDPALYDGIERIFVKDSEIWTPELFVDNEVELVKTLQDDHIHFKVGNNGTVEWEFPKIFTTACDIDTTYYPFDTQSCTIELTTLAYTKQEMHLKHLKNKINDEDLGKNGEWAYLGSKVYSKELTETKTDGSTHTFAVLDFELILERRSGFYVNNIILPVFLTSFLLLLVFTLPADSGEKIGYSLTVLLALAVLLTIISDSMPSTSMYISILSVYLAFSLILGCICVALSVLVLRIHFQPETLPVPKWLQKATSGWIGRVSCYSGCCTELKAFDSVKAANTPQESALDEDIFQELSWKEIASVLDKFFFVILFIILTLFNVVLLFIMRIGGYIASVNKVEGAVSSSVL